MDILIHGLEMPKNCYNCWLGHKCPKYEALLWNEIDKKRKTDCPLIPVPPHGRLGDLDELAKRIKDEGRNQAEYYADRYAPVVMAYGDCYGKVQSAPTIIPADDPKLSATIKCDGSVTCGVAYSEEVYKKYVDTAGNLRWTGTHSGEHIIQKEFMQNWHEESET